MAWYDEDSWLTRGLGPGLSTIILTGLIALALPVLLHWWLYRKKARAVIPHILVMGPSESGKTALVTILETRSQAAQTHTSIVPLTIETTLPASNTPHSYRYRSAADVETSSPKPVRVTDTPGHPKLRHHAFTRLDAAATTPPTGIIFVVDAANLSGSGAGSESGSALADTASYLHDVLLALQRAHTARKGSRGAEVPVLLAANKADLFTALPAGAVKAALEAEIALVWTSRARGIAAAVGGKGDGIDAVADPSDGDDGEIEPLGGAAEGKFEFAAMQEWNVQIEVLAGNVVGADGPGVEAWWDWIARCM